MMRSPPPGPPRFPVWAHGVYRDERARLSREMIEARHRAEAERRDQIAENRRARLMVDEKRRSGVA